MVPPIGDIPARPMEIEQFIDQFLSTVCDTSRRHILECLSIPEDHVTELPERSVGEIATHLGLAASTTSEHLKELLRVHLLVTRKEGKRTYYRLRNRELVKTFHAMIISLEDHYKQGILPPGTTEES
ncbi:MAG TPA: metalloregulator ArsR/SmtB family transcription factor [Ktedonobacteraceae bacterium]|jgi:DNA-binding transcriptional ArsR family regulator